MANETAQAAEQTEQGTATLDETTVNDLVEIINLLAAARDAMSDDMVTRLARTTSEGVTLLDRLVRNEGLISLLQVLDRPESQYLMKSLANALGQMSRDLAVAPPAKGGIGGMWRLAREPGTQEGLRALSILGKYWNEGLRDLHRHGDG